MKSGLNLVRVGRGHKFIRVKIMEHVDIYSNFFSLIILVITFLIPINCDNLQNYKVC